VTYGTGTRSHNRSPERRQMKEEVARATKEFEERKVFQEIELPVACGCIHRPYPHLHHESAPCSAEAARWNSICRMSQR
jgi:hypothetical protein